MTKIFISNSLRKTHKFAEEFAKNLETGDTIVFYGDLGSGKTTFIQGLAKGLKIKKRIISPTFIILRHYIINKELAPKVFYHVDLYRTNSESDLVGIGLDQIINEKDSIKAIEWGEKLQDLLPSKRTEIKLERISENKRKISINKYE